MKNRICLWVLGMLARIALAEIAVCQFLIARSASHMAGMRVYLRRVRLDIQAIERPCQPNIRLYRAMAQRRAVRAGPFTDVH